MEVYKQKTKPLQWHPAFFAGIQIELAAEKDNLIFENEHQLGTKPKEIDVLIVKRKNEIPISLVCRSCPRLLLRHLREARGFTVTREDEGIYYIKGDKIPIQLILTKELSEEENLWLRSLTDDLQNRETAEELIRDYGTHKDDKLYKSMMNIIVRANKDTFQEVKNMCEALEELMKDELDARENKGREEGIKAGIRTGIREGIQALIEDNIAEKKSEEQIIAKLMKLFSLDEDEARRYYKQFAD